MMLDTTYLLPFSRIYVDTDLLRFLKDRDMSIGGFSISSISIFEFQAKAAKLNVSAKYTVEAVKGILGFFRVEQIHGEGVVEIAARLSRMLNDYVDCLILATAIVLKEDLVTEDSRIHMLKGRIKTEYGISIFNCKEFLGVVKERN